MTASDIAGVALDWWTDDDISYEVEQKHELGDDVAVPAVGVAAGKFLEMQNIFARISSNLPETFSGNSLCEHFLPQR